MPQSGAINGTLPTFPGVIHPKLLFLLCLKAQSSVEELWQQQVTQPRHSSTAAHLCGSGRWLWRAQCELGLCAGVASGTAFMEPWSKGCLRWRVFSPMDCLQVVCKKTLFSYD